jgi:TonB-linked SusC/RagA family outer membrane protein
MKLKINGFLTLLLALATQITFAQDRSVSGTVSDNTGLPIPGASVLIKGTKTGTQTDANGKYTIKADENQTLVISFVGMASKQVSAKTSTVNVKLADDAVQLEGVVVTAFGIKKQKRALSYATSTVSAKELTEVNNTNVFESLSGKVAGVDISAPAQVGASTKVVIRGFNSLTGRGPLYVIDGTPIVNSNSGSAAGSASRSFDAGNGISDLDPNNIESMTILKGAAASALYGSRAGQGVILITTKTAKNKAKLTTEFSTSFDVSEVARVPHLQNSFGQGWNGKSWSSWSGSSNTVSNENGSWGPAFNGEIRPWGAILNNAQQIKPYVALENNYRDFFEKGSTFTNSFRVSGGGENSNFSLSFSDVNSDGIVPSNADSYKRRTFGFNGLMSSDKLTFKASFNYVKKDQNIVNTGQGDDAGEGNTATQELLQIPRDVSVVDLKDYKNNPYNTNSNYFSPYTSNPYWTVNENKTFADGNRIFGNANLNYKFNNNFSLSYQAGGDYKTEKVKSYGAIIKYEVGSPQQLAGANSVVGGVTERNYEYVEFNTDLILNYSKSLNDDLSLSSFVGFGTNERKTSELIASISTLDIPNFYELSNSSVKPIVTQRDRLRRSYSTYGSAELAYKNKYFLTVTGRNEWTSTLPLGANSYFYPSVSLSSILVEDGGAKYLNYLKLRTAYAKIANDTEPYQVFSTLTQASSNLGFGDITFPFGGINAYEFSGNLGNADLVPEITKEFEIGFESNLFQKRVNLDLSLYNKKTNDLLFRRPLPTSTGYRTQTANILDLTNKGVEVVLNIIPLKLENFQWDITTTFTKNKSNVDAIKGADKITLDSNYGVTFNAQVGQPLGVFSTFVPRVNNNGQYIVNASTGYYEATTDEQNVGTSERDFIMGLKNKFTYKNVSLSFGFDWKKGGEMYSYTKRLSHFTGNGIETTYNDRNPFVIPNSVNEVKDNDGKVTGYVENATPITFENITDFYNPGNNPGIEQTHVIDKTFIRLRDLSLTFNIASKYLKGTGLNSGSFSVYGKNLMLWTPAENPYVDPELSTFGDGLLSEQGEFGANPSQRSYGVSLKLTF